MRYLPNATIRNMWWLSVPLCLLLACSTDSNGSGGTSTDSDLDISSLDSTDPLKTWGQVCTQDTDCATGLCLNNEFAAFGWCSAECDVVKEPCAADSEGNIGGWCIEMPEDFPDTPRRFCAPACKDIFECQARTDLWEQCQTPEWKGNILYGDATDIRVCQSPSAQGKPDVDPVTCSDWKAAFTGYNKQVATCEAYCEYLVTCKEVPSASTYNKDCCGYGCALQMVVDGEIQEPYEKKKQCYEQSFFAFRGTPKICDSPTETCGANPEDPTPQ
ncbi:MAG: hypothetical protein ACI9WU_002164 [Myxococcota bacterium]|jgi:hypothetical protein